MYRHPFWILFLCLIMICVLGYTGYTLIKVWQYLRLDRQTAAQTIQWNVLAINDEAYVPIASYSFIVNGKSYRSETQLEETYLNAWTAQEAIERLEYASPLIWYVSYNPEISSLQKHFPLKQSVYTGFLLILALYFIGMGYYIKRRF